MAEKYKIIQVGLTTFNKTAENEFICRPYTFYVFPEENSGNNMLNSELSSIIFNREHKMDFNKWIYNGIPYINSRFEKQLIDNLSESDINLYDPTNMQKFKNIILFSDQDRNKYEDFCKVFSDFLYSDAKDHIFENYPKYLQYYIINNMQESILKRLFFSTEKVNRKEYFVISKCEGNQKKIKMEEEQCKKLEKIKKSRGFKSIFDAIIQHKKVMIGHSCIIDLNFLISHFSDQLPHSYDDWKKMMLGFFDKYALIFIINS